jgi:hypothetical protein
MGYANLGQSLAQGEFSQTRANQTLASMRHIIQDRVETGLQTGLMAIVWL